LIVGERPRLWVSSAVAEEIGVSQMHVSRLLNRTLEQLRTSLDEDSSMNPAS
jgi:RNA polymerase sigma-B factor